MMSDAGMRPVAMHRPRGVAAGAVVRAQPVTETSLMESGMMCCKEKSSYMVSHLFTNNNRFVKCL